MDKKTMETLKEQYHKRAGELVSQMSLKEKVDLMGGKTPETRILLDGLRYNKTPYLAGGNQRLGVPPMKFCDGPRGLVPSNGTCFPVAMQRGASFDVELEERVGEAIGKEIRAVGGNYFGGVCINLLRHPAGGRAQETYGEDPFHIGQMGAAVTRGVQKHNVIACVKHYALNNQEDTRMKVDVTCDERTLREVYLPHFKDCIDAGAASVMGAYNKFRGEHLCQHEYLLRTILKGEWGFYGFVISDFWQAVHDTAAAANGGLDVEMANAKYYGKKLVKAVEKGEVPKDIVDEAARRIVRTILMFTEAADPLEDYPESLIACEEHAQLALEAAEKSIVLLKNEQTTLPFNREKLKKIALLGELGDAANIGDFGSSQVRPPYVITPLEGLLNLLGSSVEVLYCNGEDLGEAKRAAAEADAVLFVVGNRSRDEGENIEVLGKKFGGDRENLGLRADEIELIHVVAPLNQNAVVLLVSGSAIMMEEWKDSVPAILHVFYPGMEGGTAMARILFGEVNPGGKLPFTIPADTRHLPEFNPEALQVEYSLYHGYTRMEVEGNQPAFAYGFGLSYTTFSHANASFTVNGDRVDATVEVTNTGDRSGDQVVQFYVGFENSAVDRPKKLLKGFTRVFLVPGETKTVLVSCPVEKLRWYNPASSSWELEHMEYQVYIGSSSKEGDLIKGTLPLFPGTPPTNSSD
jgi:beta-glucosidase